MITIVSGLPRSGTSMMMQMLVAGGLVPLEDHVRQADADNPRGYYELEAVKKMKDDSSFLADAEGKVVKIISMLLYHLPAGHEYRIVFMQRKLEEILASQAEMLRRRGQPPGPDDREMTRLYQRHLQDIDQWLTRRDNIRVMYCPYSDVQQNPAQIAQRVTDFLSLPMDVSRMIAAVDPVLHRQKASPPSPGH